MMGMMQWAQQKMKHLLPVDIELSHRFQGGCIKPNHFKSEIGCFMKPSSLFQMTVDLYSLILG